MMGLAGRWARPVVRRLAEIAQSLAGLIRLDVFGQAARVSRDLPLDLALTRFDGQI
ncbi:hypothetical protein OHA18_25920 [Kribbella sp. NBC_00709]|nr:hypothetical protein [Kribbella sp. NBC_00709]